MIRTLKAVRLFNHILLGILLLVLTGALWNNGTQRVKTTKQWWLRRITRLMGMEVDVQGALPTKGDTGLLFVSNHVSWTDIPVIGSLTQINFLSKAEVRNWPLIGYLADGAGTLFIKRGSGDTNHVAKQIANYLEQGRSVLFFPEGTTSNGTTVSKFHRKLFRTCEHIETQVCPVAIHYAVEGYDHNPVAFIGDDEFTQHIWKLLSFRKIKVTVSILEPVALCTDTLEAQVNQIRQNILAKVEQHHARQRINTNVLWPDASNPVDLQDEAASF